MFDKALKNRFLLGTVLCLVMGPLSAQVLSAQLPSPQSLSPQSLSPQSLSPQSKGRMPTDMRRGPAIEGYSPLSYFEVGRPEKGSPAYTSTYQGKDYWFTSAEQLARFEADPAAYAPAFPDHCPYNLSLGRAVAIDPHNFMIVGGNLLLFHDREEMASVGQDLDAEKAQGMLQRARAARSNLLELDFD